MQVIPSSNGIFRCPRLPGTFISMGGQGIISPVVVAEKLLNFRKVRRLEDVASEDPCPRILRVGVGVAITPLHKVCARRFPNCREVRGVVRYPEALTSPQLGRNGNGALQACACTCFSLQVSDSTLLTSSQTMIPGICSRTVSIPSGTSSPGRNLLVATTCLGLNGTLYSTSLDPIILSKSLLDPKDPGPHTPCLNRRSRRLALFDSTVLLAGQETCVLFQDHLAGFFQTAPPKVSLAPWTGDIISENAKKKGP